MAASTLEQEDIILLEDRHASREIVVAWRAGSNRTAEGRLLAEVLRESGDQNSPTSPSPIMARLVRATHMWTPTVCSQ